jgi:hypothetical protein
VPVESQGRAFRSGSRTARREGGSTSCGVAQDAHTRSKSGAKRLLRDYTRPSCVGQVMRILNQHTKQRRLLAVRARTMSIAAVETSSTALVEFQLDPITVKPTVGSVHDEGSNLGRTSDRSLAP